MADIWIDHQQATASHTTVEAWAFLKEIEQNKPDLLSFQKADKWQIVRGWLLDAQLIRE